MNTSAIGSQLEERHSRMKVVSQRIVTYKLHVEELLNQCDPREFEGRFEGSISAGNFGQWQLSVEDRFMTWASWGLATSLSNWRTMIDDIRELWRSHPSPRYRAIEKYVNVELEDIIEAVSTAMPTHEEVNKLFQLPHQNACEVIDLFNAILTHSDLLNLDVRDSMFRTMKKLCEVHVVLPPACLLSPHELVMEDEHPIARGGFGEICRGQWQSDGSIVHVALKSFLTAQNEDLQNVRKGVYREANLWRHLRHRNLLPFLGVYDMPPPLQSCIVSRWMKNGSITDFLRQNPHANRLLLLVGIVMGLEYLHSKDIVHGDLKGANILIDDNGVPRLADFRLAIVVSRMQTINDDSGSHACGTTRWMAPELFDPEGDGLPHIRPSKETDVYALAMVMWEVYTGLIPFYECRYEFQVIKEIMSGRRPTRSVSEDIVPPVIEDHIWILMEECWDAHPENRPNVHTVLNHLGTEDDIANYVQLADIVEPYLFDAILMGPDLLNLHVHKSMFRTLKKLCENYGVLPRASILSPHELVVEDERPIARGGFGDIRRGQWQSGGSIVRVALKSFIVAQNEDLQNVRKQINEEAIQWRYLHHPNVVPFLGACYMPSPLQLCIVSHWMENGSITDFLRQNPHANRLLLLVGIATGLEYLHSKDIVHGDLKGANILIDDNGVPRLADFGLASVVYRMQTVDTTPQSHRGGTYRWMAPELLDPEEYGLPHVRPSKETDVYALAMVMWEVYTGLVPFHECRNEGQVVKKIISSKRPTPSKDTVPPVIEDHIWILMEECWDARPEKRPSVHTVLNHLGAEEGMHGTRVTVQDHLRVSPHIRLTSEHIRILLRISDVPGPALSKSPGFGLTSAGSATQAQPEGHGSGLSATQARPEGHGYNAGSMEGPQRSIDGTGSINNGPIGGGPGSVGGGDNNLSPSSPLMTNGGASLSPGGTMNQPMSPGTNPRETDYSGESQVYRAKAMYRYTASPDDPTEISFSKGETMDILDKQGKWWQARKADGTIGIVPSNFLEIIGFSFVSI